MIFKIFVNLNYPLYVRYLYRHVPALGFIKIALAHYVGSYAGLFVSLFVSLFVRVCMCVCAHPRATNDT